MLLTPKDVFWYTKIFDFRDTQNTSISSVRILRTPKDVNLRRPQSTILVTKLFSNRLNNLSILSMIRITRDRNDPVNSRLGSSRGITQHFK